MDNRFSEDDCPIGSTIRLIKGKNKYLILWILKDATLRFGQISKLMPQSSTKMLAQQLRELEVANLIIRTAYPFVPPMVEYKLSDLGRSIIPILEALYEWGTVYFASNGKEVNCYLVDLRNEQIISKSKKQPWNNC